VIGITSESVIDIASEPVIDIASESVIDMPRNTHFRARRLNFGAWGACEQRTRLFPLVAVHTDGIETECIREAGPVHVGYQFWLRLGMEEILPAVGLSERECKLSCAMTLSRLVHPSSELAMPAWIRTTALPDILETDFENLAEDALYRHLDKLHPQRAGCTTW
jgi:hypothetical protein